MNPPSATHPTAARGTGSATAPAAVEHLIAQAEVYAPEAEQLLDRIGLGAGASAIDVGCGALGILPLLRARVGERGTSSDSTSSRGCWRSRPGSARARSARQDRAGRTRPAPACPRLLRSSPRAHAAAQPHRPGARGRGDGAARAAWCTVALQEPDPRTWVCDPPHPAFDRLRAGSSRSIRAPARTSRSAPPQLPPTPVARRPRERHRRARGPATTTTRSCSTLCALLREPTARRRDPDRDRLDRDVAEVRRAPPAP